MPATPLVSSVSLWQRTCYWQKHDTWSPTYRYPSSPFKAKRGYVASRLRSYGNKTFIHTDLHDYMYVAPMF